MASTAATAQGRLPERRQPSDPEPHTARNQHAEGGRHADDLPQPDGLRHIEGTTEGTAYASPAPDTPRASLTPYTPPASLTPQTPHTLRTPHAPYTAYTGARLSPGELEAQLVDALMKVPVLDDLKNRRLCVSNTLARLGQQLSVSDFAEKKPHLVEMVQVFGAVEQGWQKLAAAVSFLADYDLPSAQAAAVAEGLAHHTGDLTPRRELASHLGGLDRRSLPALEGLFVSAAGEAFGPLPATARTAWEAYELLENCNVPPDGVPRAVRFVQEVAYAVGPDLGDALRRWLSRYVRTSVSQGSEAMEVLERSRRDTGPRRRERGGTAYLVVRIHPLSDAPGHVWLTCWTSAGGAWEPRQRDDRRLPLDEVPSRVAALVDQEETRLRHHTGDIVLEFILPVDMVNEPVEDWPRANPFGEAAGDTGFDPPFGMEYQVVIRSLERIEALESHRVWNLRWEVLAGGAAVSSHRCEQGDDDQQALLYKKLRRDPSIVLLALGTSPDEAAGRSQLVLGLRLGLPVLLWAHQGSLDDREHTAVDDLTDVDGWESLRERVTRLRFASDPRDDGREGALRSRIAVLWDDPSRLPEVPESAG
ncbi:VMAP-C domain-containing protein [Streptomyces naganishii]|uniref:VMAP-C domain-containing protein n=1 Tax=Streptomyces naganishii TaxID=285447 RepID=UPI00167D0D6F|nr:hypothetical protein [Streptomyces naganishii]